MNTSRKAMEWLTCFSILDLMLGCILFEKFKICKGALPCLRQFLGTESP